MKPCLLAFLRGSLQRAFAASATLSLVLGAAPVFAQGHIQTSSQPGTSSDRVTFVTRPADSPLASFTDAGPIPSGQSLTLTLTLAPTPDRAAALTRFLSDLTSASSPNFHKWITPQQFASTYGATTEQIAAATSWAQSQGLNVVSVSPSAARLTVSGSALQVQSAFNVSLESYRLNSLTFFASTIQPSLPASVAAFFTSIEGLDNLPLDLPSYLAASSKPATSVNGQPASLAPASLATLIDQNTTPLLNLDATFGAGTPSPSRIAAYSSLFRQAAAQGITTLLTRTAVSGGIPSGLPELTVVAQSGDNPDLTTPFAARPDWQNASGLPADALRHAPDLTVSSFNAFGQTIATLAQASGGRLGNINPTLYALAPTKSLFTQPDDAAPGTWEASTGLGLVDLTVLAQAFPRGTGGVAVYITSTNYSPVHGQTFTLTATVYPTDGGTPTGTMTFSSTQPGFASATVPVNGGGAAVSPAFQLPGGTYPITATYSGDSTYAQSTGNTTIFVGAEAANFTLSAPSTATLGSTFAVTASLASSSGFGTPTGNVTVSVTGAANQTQAVSGSGATASSTFNFVANQAGTLAIQATCTSGDANFTCYSQPTASTTVAKATPTVTLSLSTNTPLAGANVTFTVGVGGVTGIAPTGTVKIMDNNVQISSITLPATTASAPLTSGTSHSITAAYPGDGNYQAVTSAASTATTGLAPTTITVTPYPASFPYGATTTLVIAVAPASGSQVNGAAPSGSVTVTPGTQASVTQQLNNGNVNVTLSNLPVGTYPITVAYSGDASYAASTNTSQTVTVTPFAAVITPQLSYNMFTTGSTQTLTVQFASSINAPVPQNAAFIATLNGVTYQSNFSINPGGVNATGQVTIYAPIAGTYQLQVTCVPNPAFTCNVPAPITVTSTATSTVNPPPSGTGTTPTQTALVTSSTAPGAGQSVTLTATVTAAASALAANPLSGTVSFYDGTTLLNTEPLGLIGSNYVATDIATLTGGLAHNITATYNGNSIYAPSTSTPPIAITTVATPAAITLTSSVTSGIAGQSITFTAKVTGSTSSGVGPTGTVSFFLAGTTPALLYQTGLGSAGSGTGIATYTTTGLPAGSETVYAVYSGDANFSSETSNSITIGLSDYTLNFTPASLSLKAGQTGTATLTVNLVNSFPGTIVFGCTPPPNTGITCSFSPATLTGAGVSTLTVTTLAPRAQGSQSASSSIPGNPAARLAGGLTLAALLCLILPGRARRRLPTLLLVFLALAITADLGCSSSTYYSSNPSSPVSGTPLGTSILTINTAATNGAASIRHDTFFQVTVQ